MTARAARHLYLAIALAHAAGSAAPWVHALLDAEVDCDECKSRLADGPRLEARCDGGEPCEDPTHHHHPAHGHDHGQCPVCQYKVHGVEPGLARWSLLAAPALAAHAERFTDSRRRIFAHTPPVRGPPTCS